MELLRGDREVVRIGHRGAAALAPENSLAAVEAAVFMRAAGASAVTLNWGVVTPRAIQVCHRAGVAVYVWTVNEPGLAKTLVESGVDAIITDDPRLFDAPFSGIPSTS